MRGKPAIIIALLVVAAALPAMAEENQRVVSERSALFPASSLFLIDIHGSFRSRTELWKDVDMGLTPVPNKWGVYPGLSTDRSVRSTTDFRLRLSPDLHIGENSRVHAVVDLFSVQAGEGGRSATAMAMLDNWAIPAPGSMDSPLDSAYVRMMWGEIELFHLLTLKAGRLPAHWGLGVLENDGSDMEVDGGDAVDGVEVSADLPWGLWAAISFDLPLEGRAVQSAMAPWEAGMDSGDFDDIIQWRFKVSMDFGDREAGNYFSWGLYNRLRWQEFSSLGSQSPYEECQLYDWAPQYGCNELFWRDAFIWTPDLYLEASAMMTATVAFKMEAELAGRVGSIDGTRFVTEPSSRSLYGLGGALRGRIEAPRFTAGVEFGGASGDAESQAFGILDEPIIGEPDSTPGSSGSSATNSTLTSFALNPNFVTDRILFRRVIGAVTNAFYVKPSAKVILVEKGNASLSFNASALYAMAFVASATPGEAAPLGVEANAGLGARFGKHVLLSLDGAMLFPLDGLKSASSLTDPLPWSTRVLLDFSF